MFVLILFLAFGPLKGTLENKFSIPGSDAQKATDVLAAKFDARNGAVLQVVMVAPDGERLDTDERKAAIDAALATASKAESATAVTGPADMGNTRLTFAASTIDVTVAIIRSPHRAGSPRSGVWRRSESDRARR